MLSLEVRTSSSSSVQLLLASASLSSVEQVFNPHSVFHPTCIITTFGLQNVLLDSAFCLDFLWASKKSMFSFYLEDLLCKILASNLSWHAIASWTWDAQDETCGICRMAFDGCCPDCKHPGDDCPLIWGACNHAFHLHCILKWVNSQTSQAHCPMCRREWQFKE
ncbi:uncharacterized protein LOC129319615 [Prosopis cineraria]|uniref:uncharacterized protein LOC129319615 n=2 Tax=Prosopis cineraria TaxID=364024 RepID=UPI00241088DA|nr:uncharacterized protein LOC129319615 [Prosopis cineraria]